MKRIVTKLDLPPPPKPKPHAAGTFRQQVGIKPGGLWSVVRGSDDVIVTNRKERT